MASMLSLAMRRMDFRATTFRLSKITTVQECFFYQMSMVTKAVESEILCTDWPALATSTILCFALKHLSVDSLISPGQWTGGRMVTVDNEIDFFFASKYEYSI